MSEAQITKFKKNVQDQIRGCTWQVVTECTAPETLLRRIGSSGQSQTSRSLLFHLYYYLATKVQLWSYVSVRVHEYYPGRNPAISPGGLQFTIFQSSGKLRKTDGRNCNLTIWTMSTPRNVQSDSLNHVDDHERYSRGYPLLSLEITSDAAVCICSRNQWGIGEYWDERSHCDYKYRNRRPFLHCLDNQYERSSCKSPYTICHSML